MKYLSYIIVALAVSSTIYVGYNAIGNGKSNQMNDQTNNELIAQQVNSAQWETRTDNQSSVTVTITPIALGKDADPWKFDVTLDTHSGSLDQDMIEVVALIDDKGTATKPIAWDGPGPGGHHRSGIISFNPITPTPKDIVLKVFNVDSILERSFQWNIQ